MKFLLPIFFIFLYSCNSGVSKNDRSYIEAKISYHNAMVAERFKRDSLNGNKDTSLFTKGNLQTEEFLNYCNLHGLDPRKIVEKLSDK